MWGLQPWGKSPYGYWNLVSDKMAVSPHKNIPLAVPQVAFNTASFTAEVPQSAPAVTVGTAYARLT